MSLFQKVFGKQPAAPRSESQGYFKTFNAYQPVFRTWGGQLYESEMVRAAINARATHISKLTPQITGTARPKLRALLRTAPNEFMTWSQFLYRLSTILDVNNTAFIVPVFDDTGEVTGIYPLLTAKCEIKQYGGEPYLQYTMATGDVAAIEFRRVGIMTKFQYSDDFYGEGNSALRSTMQLISMQNQAIEEGVKSAATYRFLAQLSNFSKPEDLARERKRFSSENLSADAEGGGLLLFPNTYSNIQQIKSQPFVVDAEQMKMISANVNNYFGVNEDILQNKAYGDAWSAFYEGVIESFAVQFSDVVSKMLFTVRERTVGNGIMLTANRLQYMSNADKLNVSAQLLDRGIMSINDIREIWNLPPVEGGDRRIIRGEYYDANAKLNEQEGNDNASET